MGVVSRLSKRRAKNRQDIKVAQARARSEVEASAKALERREKLLARTEKQLIKEEKKGLKAKRKHELQLARTEYKKRKAGKFNVGNVTRYANAARIAVPILLPLVYRGVTQARDSVTQNKAKRAGVSPEQLAQFSGHGAELHARIEGIRSSLEGTALSSGFKRDAQARLDELRSATDNAEFMTAEQRRRAHHAINSDIDKLTAEIQDRITRG